MTVWWAPPPRTSAALLLTAGGLLLRFVSANVTDSHALLADTYHSLCRLILLCAVVACRLEKPEGGLRNTFGWARVAVVGRLTAHTLFASFALSLVVAALQQAVHSEHGDRGARCDPAPRLTLALGAAGLPERLLVYLLLTGEEVRRPRGAGAGEGRDGLRCSGPTLLELLPADIISSVFVVTAALVSVFGDPCTNTCRQLIDPVLSVLSSLLLVVFNYPYMKEAGMVLLETVPEGLSTHALLAEAERVPGVHSMHDLHVWQLFPKHVIATAHVFYSNRTDYAKTEGLVREVFARHHIAVLTLQPEFLTTKECAGGGEALASVLRGRCTSACAAHCTQPRCCTPVSASVISSPHTSAPRALAPDASALHTSVPHSPAPAS